LPSIPYWLDEANPLQPFPHPRHALQDPDGLLAIGGSLHPARLLLAYSQGIFPWYNDDQPILWWSPNPRSVVSPEQIKISRSLKKTLKKDRFSVTFDQDFSAVIEACSHAKVGRESTWIGHGMKTAYTQLFQAGDAHSVECWQDNRLVGGLYGVSIGRVFFGESMFSHTSDASKVAFVYLANWLKNWHYVLIDAQVHSAHMESLGAQTIPRDVFLQRLDACHQAPHPDAWTQRKKP